MTWPRRPENKLCMLANFNRAVISKTGLINRQSKYLKSIQKLYIRVSIFFSSPEPLGSQGELIVYPSSRRPSVRRPSASASSSTLLKDLLRNRWADQSQIQCGASLGRGNDILFAASGSHDQGGRHAHIW